MIFSDTSVRGAFVIDPDPISDERGFFARIWCRRELASRGLEADLAQSSISFNRRAGTLRGLHYQSAPYEEVKIVRCTRGSLFDVVVDLRPGSPTFLRHYGVTLTAANRRMLYVPKGCAHGFQTLEDDVEVTYLISEFYEAEHSRGVRWNDPIFGIEWPQAEQRIMNSRDLSYPDYVPGAVPDIKESSR